MGLGKILQGVGGFSQGIAETGAAIGQQVMQGLGLLNLGLNLPGRAGKISQIGQDLYDKGQAIWNPTLDRMRERQTGASKWWDANQDTANSDNSFLRDAYNESKAGLNQSLYEARAGMAALKSAADEHLADIKSRVASSESQFQADRTQTLDSLKQNAQFDMQALRAANDSLITESISKGMQTLQENGRSDDPEARAQLVATTKESYKKSLGAQLGTRLAAFETTMADTHTKLTETRASLMAKNTETLSGAHDSRTKAYEAAGKFLSETERGIALNKFELYRNTSQEAREMAAWTNQVDQEVSGLQYEQEVQLANTELQANALLTSGDFAMAGMLYNWSFTVPGYSDIINSSLAAANSGGGGGSSGGGFNLGATVAGTGGSFGFTK